MTIAKFASFYSFVSFCFLSSISVPGQYRWAVSRLPELLDPLVALGLRSIILFGVLTDASKKTACGSCGFAADAPVPRALALVRRRYPALFVAVDVCLCAYTSHGHCGILQANDNNDKPADNNAETSDNSAAVDRFAPAFAIDNQASIAQLARMSVAFALAGAQMISPSDMMDGRVGAIKAALASTYTNGTQGNGAAAANPSLGSRVPVMSYSAKFASCFYGPFRDAAGSGAKFGDRGGYQLPPFSRGLALRAIDRDLDEGGDFIMVKPGMPYLDILRDCADRCGARGVPVAVYHVSGEYAMLWHGAKAGAFGLREAVMEAMGGFRRAGATVILTYYAPLVLQALSEMK